MARQEKAPKPPEPGLNKRNLSVTMEKIAERIGSRWVTNEPSVLISYYRDFTPTPGKAPNIVALPSCTEEVQEVVKIARDHKVPIVPVSTGFNHGGMHLPRKGGIMIDLKRMDKIEVDTDTQTVTCGPHARNAAVYEAVSGRTVEGVRLRPALSMSMGSSSILANYIERGGSAVACRYHNNPDMLTSMTWVLPDGEIIKVGPYSIPQVGKTAVAWGSGVDLNGMFTSADGSFGICTEVVLRLIPEYAIEKLYIFDTMDKKRSLENSIDFMYTMCHSDIYDFLYKAHGASIAAGVAGTLGADAESASQMAKVLPHNLVMVCLAANSDEEFKVKEEILLELAKEKNMYQMKTDMVGGEAYFNTDLTKKIGPSTGVVMRTRGAFQWTACNVKMDLIPHIYAQYKPLVEKYLTTSDPDDNIHTVLTGVGIQGPYAFGRCGTCEMDFFWDQGNPIDAVRYREFLRKVTELYIANGCTLWRIMHGHGELYAPHLGRYWEIVQGLKRSLDPDNISHPDIHPVTDDYI